MFVSDCPRCGEALRVPAIEGLAEAEARCPWCQESFPYRDISGSLPPILQVYSADGQLLSESPQVAANAAAANGLPPTIDQADQGTTEAAFPRLEIDDESTGQQGWDFDSIDSGEDASVSPISAPGGHASVKTMPVPMVRKKKGSGIGTAIGVVLGGLAAIPLAGGILMAMGRTPDWGFWPFLGPSGGSGDISAAAPLDADAFDNSTTGRQSFMSDDEGRSFGQSFASDGSLIDEDASENVWDESAPQQNVLQQLGEPESDPETEPVNDPFASPEETGSPEEATESPENDASDEGSAAVEPTADEAETSPTTERVGDDESDQDREQVASDALADEEQTAATKPADNNRLTLPEIPEEDFAEEDFTAQDFADSAEAASQQPTIADVNEAIAASEIAESTAAEEIEMDVVDSPDLEALQTTTTDDLGTNETTQDAEATVDSDATVEATLETTAEDLGQTAPGDNILVGPSEVEDNTDSESDNEPLIAAVPANLPESTPANSFEAVDSPKAVASAADQPEQTPSDAAMVTDPVSINGALTDTGSDFQRAIEMTQQLSLFDGSAEDRRRLLARTYLKIAEAAEKAATDPEAARSLASELANSAVVSELEYAAPQWLKHGKRTTDGIAIVGRPIDDGDRVTLMLKDGKVVDLNRVDTPEAEKILVIGTIQSQDEIDGVVAVPVP